MQKTEEKEARRQTDTKTSTPANGVLNTEQGGGWLQTYGAVVGRRFRIVTKLTTKNRIGRGYLWGVFFLLLQLSKHPREMVITPKASTSIFEVNNRTGTVHLCRVIYLNVYNMCVYRYIHVYIDRHTYTYAYTHIHIYT